MVGDDTNDLPTTKAGWCKRRGFEWYLECGVGRSQIGKRPVDQVAKLYRVDPDTVHDAIRRIKAGGGAANPPQANDLPTTKAGWRKHRAFAWYLECEADRYRMVKRSVREIAGLYKFHPSHVYAAIARVRATIEAVNRAREDYD